MKGPKIGPYRLDSVLWRRGRLLTWSATDESLGRTVWVTTVDASDRMTPALEARLTHEARWLARLGGTSLPTLLELGSHERGSTLVTTATEGHRLDEVARAIARRPVPWQDVVGVAEGMARAVGSLHGAGLVHGELSLASFVLTASGSVLLTSIGAGAVERAGATSDEPTEPDEGSEIVGLAHDDYRSPEERMGERAGLESDVFALGLLVAELAMGRHPYAGPEGSESIARRVRRGEPARLDLADMPREIGRILERAIDPSAPLRFGSAVDFEQALSEESGLRGDGVRAVRAVLVAAGFSLGDRPPMPERRARPWPLLARRAALRVGVALVAAAAGGLGALAWTSDEPQPVMSRSASGPMGSVRVLARPWAEVVIDGKLVDTTPIGAPLALPAGPHEIVLRHPAAPEERRRIEIREGSTVLVDVDLRVVRPAKSVSDPTP